MRRKGGRVWLKVCFSIFLCLAIAEVGGRVAWLLRHGEFFSAGEAWKGQNAFAAEAGATLAGYTATLASHPYLAHVHKPGPSVNRQGLYGRDFPQARDPHVYQVLVTRGSVACQLAGIRPEDGALTVELEKNYISPDGRPIRVYNGADVDFLLLSLLLPATWLVRYHSSLAMRLGALMIILSLELIALLSRNILYQFAYNRLEKNVVFIFSENSGLLHLGIPFRPGEVR